MTGLMVTNPWLVGPNAAPEGLTANRSFRLLSALYKYYLIVPKIETICLLYSPHK
jgi:hypothetical protein